jgi:hypothetical protein
MPACPHDGTTSRYTDPLLQVRCPTCFNVLNDEPAGIPIGALQDLGAPMIVAGHVYPNATGTYGTGAL